MKKVLKQFFCGVVLSGISIVFGEFDSLKQRSPFGDAAPKPIVKSQAKPTAQITPPTPPKKPDLNIGLTGYLKIGNQKFFSVRNKTQKEVLHEVIRWGEKSHQGYVPIAFDEKQLMLSLRVDNNNYMCKLGEEEKKQNTKVNASNNQKGSSKPSNVNSNQNPYANYNYNFDDWDFDDWDFDDDDF